MLLFAHFCAPILAHSVSLTLATFFPARHSNAWDGCTYHAVRLSYASRRLCDQQGRDLRQRQRHVACDAIAWVDEEGICAGRGELWQGIRRSRSAQRCGAER